jgi:hypothetical protein
MRQQNEMYNDLPFKPADGPLYLKPNGGNRILPPFYASLENMWVRSNGMPCDPAYMNDGHIENTLKLLQESHGNLIGRSTSILGKMHRHFGNLPEIRSALEQLCIAMQKVEVNEIYPVFEVLANEQAARNRFGTTKVTRSFSDDLETSDLEGGQLEFELMLKDW